MLHGEQGAPANPLPRSVERTQRLRGVRLLVGVEDNALNRQVAAELLSSEGARWPSPTAGWRAFSRCWRRACRSTRCWDMQMPDIDGSEATRRICADGRLAGPIPAMTANASLSTAKPPRGA